MFFIIPKNKEVTILIYKPTSASPHTDIIDPNREGGIVFACQTMSSCEISGIRLMICNKHHEYYFDIALDNQNLKITESNYGKTITFTYTNNLIPSYVIRCKDGYKLRDKPSLQITNGQMYTWQLRLYEEATPAVASWVGYGTIDAVLPRHTNDVYSIYSGSNRNKEVSILKIRPHTNMYFANSTNLQTNGNLKVNDKTSRIYNLYTRSDTNAKYFLNASGQSYEIKDYRFYDPSSKNLFHAKTHLDSYDTPINGYAIVDGHNVDIDGDNYTIFANYIDSDIYYFTTSSIPILTLKEEFLDVDGEKVYREIKSDSIEVAYANLDIIGTYQQEQGATVSYYSFSLEKISKNGTCSIVDSTGDIYSPTIEYHYSRFVSGETYRLILSVTDTSGVTSRRIINIEVKYNSSSNPIVLKINEYRPNHSVILDFSNLISISPKETFANNHKFISYDDQTGNISEKADAVNNACHIDEGNSVIYDEIDSVGQIDFDKYSTYYLICNIDHSHIGKVFEIFDDSVLIAELLWDGIQFKAFFYDYASNKTYSWFFSPYSDWYRNNSTKEKQTASIQAAFKKKQTDCSVPYLYYKDIPYYSTDYFHAETAAGIRPWVIVLDTQNKTALFKSIMENKSWYRPTCIHGLMKNERR